MTHIDNLFSLWHGVRTMPKPSSKNPGKRPSDALGLAKMIGDIATGQRKDPLKEPEPTPDEVRRVMSALGKQGGLKGGKARSESLTPERRAEIAQKAAKARWEKGK